MVAKTFAVSLTVLATVATAFCPAAQTEQQQSFIHAAKAVLDGNWVASMNSTLPSPNLYPHQWSWDASFVAMGYSHFDTARAIDETDALFRGQWNNGAIPHIVFNPTAVESYFPGPKFWKIETAGERGPPNAHTSGIIQPPVHSVASLAIYANAPLKDKPLALEHLRDVYPKLLAWHNYLYRERDPFNRGLVFIRHMWESGMDNSPAWDPILEAMTLEKGDVPPYKRVDKGKVGNVNERPNTFFYDRAVHLIKVFYDNDYDEARIAKESRFLVEDVLYNSILARANMALAKIADIIGETADARMHRQRAEWTGAAITKHLYLEDEGFFFDYDLVGKRHIMKRISGGAAGVYGAKLSQAQLESVIRHLFSDGFLGSDLESWTLPSVARDDPGYTNTTYWRGPAWINVNYLVADGLFRNANGNKDALRISSRLRERSVELMTKSDFYEYFNPISGSPHGGHQFSWSAALGIDMVCRPDVVDDMRPPHWAVNEWRQLPVWTRAALAAAVVLFFALAASVAAGISKAAPPAPAQSEEDDEVEDETEAKNKGRGSDARIGAVGGLRRRGQHVQTRRAR